MDTSAMSLDELFQCNGVFGHYEKTIECLKEYIENGNFFEEYCYSDGHSTIRISGYEWKFSLQHAQLFNEYCLDISCRNSENENSKNLKMMKEINKLCSKAYREFKRSCTKGKKENLRYKLESEAKRNGLRNTLK